MVRVWYEPPPGGPRSHLNRGAYGVESSMEPLFVQKLSKMKPATVILPALGIVAFVCYLPLSKYFLSVYYPTAILPSHACFYRKFTRFCSEPQELACYVEPRAPGGATCLHAIPQHEPDQWYLKQASSCCRS